MPTQALEQAIFRTLAFFDLFDFPLTAEELFRYAWTPPAVGYFEFKNSLAALVPEKIGSQYGYYFLPGRENIVEERRRRVIVVDQKLRRARRAAWLIRSVPFLRTVCICNSVAAEVAKPESDIDLFIITAPNRIWLVRLCSNLILLLIGWRRHGLKIANRICLSFYIDAAHLNMSPLSLGEDDVYLTYWVWQVLALYDQQNFYQKFISANQWTKKFIPNAGTVQAYAGPTPGELGWVGRGWRQIWETMWRGAYGDVVEQEAKSLQMTKMRRSSGTRRATESGVVVSEGVLKFHEQDRRAEFRERWLKRLGDFTNNIPVVH